MNTDELVTIAEAARIKGISRQSIHAAIDRNDLHVIEVMEPTRKVTRSSLEAYEPNANKRRSGPKPKKKTASKRNSKP